MTIGFIGLGLMGAPMAQRLAQAGHKVLGYDTLPEKMKLQGIDATDSAVQAAADAQIVITMLPESWHVRNVVSEILPFLSPGTLVIDMSTIESSECTILSDMLLSRKCSFMDAPVTGGVQGAQNGTLSIMVGGSTADFQRASPLLQIMGSRVTHMGSIGMGQMAKCCNQVVGAITLQAVCEGISLAKKAGMDVEKLLDSMDGGAADSFMLKYVGSRVLAGDMSPGFKIRLELKDLEIALRAAREHMVPLPALAVAHQLFVSRAAAGKMDDEGNQALISVYELLSSYDKPVVE